MKAYQLLKKLINYDLKPITSIQNQEASKMKPNAIFKVPLIRNLKPLTLISERSSKKKRKLLFLAAIVLAVLFFTPHNAEAQCPQDPNDLGICDTLYVETFDCDHIYEAVPGSLDSVRVAIYVTHDSNTIELLGVQDSIMGFVVPLTFWHQPPGCADSVILPNWENWNNTIMDPYDPRMSRSMFRHIVDGHTGDTVYNRLLQMVEAGKVAWNTPTVIEPHSCDGDSGDAWLAFIKQSNSQEWWEGSRVLLATLTFHVYMSEDCDTTEIGIDSTFWPPMNRLTFARHDGVYYVPRHFLPVMDTIRVEPPYGKTIDSTVDLIPYFDWGAISSYPGLAPPGPWNMGIASFWHFWDGFYFPSDSLAPCSFYPKAWLTPGVHLATNYGPDTVRVSSCPVGFSMVTVPDRNSNRCSLFVEVPPQSLIDEATDSNVIQISSGERKTVWINDAVETMVFLASCDGDVDSIDNPSPSQPLEVRLNYNDGTVDTVVFDNIHPAGRRDIIDQGYPPSWLFIYGNEVFVCDPQLYNSTYSDLWHSEAWHWYAMYPDTTKILDSLTFVGIQMGDHSEVYISALSYSKAEVQWGEAIDSTVDLTAYFDWGAVSSYAGLAPPGFMGIWSPSHSTNFYFTSDSSAPPTGPPDTARAWLIPGVHQATFFGPDRVFIPTNPMVAVPDRNSQPCSLFVQVPPQGLIDQATDSNVIQISSGKTKTISFNDTVETMVFLANCDGADYCSPDQPLEVWMNYQDGTIDTVIFDNIHPAERASNIAFPFWYTIYGNEVFGCGPFYCDLPSPYYTDAHSEFWHWYAMYPDNTKLLNSLTFVGIQSGDSSVYISAISYHGVPSPRPPCEIPNESFEEGQLGQFPSAWVKETECIGPGASCVHEAWTVNTHYYDGSRSLYMHSRVVDGGTAASYSSNTTAWTADWINCPNATSVIFRIRDIVNGHTSSWGWSNTIDVRFTDGVNSQYISVYCLGEGCNWNDYCHIDSGADGSNWFVYNVAIPPTIDKTNMKIGIQNHAHCWTWYGWFADLKFYVDMVELVRCGDVNADWEIDLGDVLYLISYLYKGGPPPVPIVEVGDVDCDGVVDLGDVLYLIGYLYKGGPEPCADCDGKLTRSMRSGAELYKGKAPAQIGFSSPSISKDGIFEVPAMCKSDVDVAGVHLEIKYDPKKINLLEPVLTPRTEGLQVYSSAKDGIGKIGILDLSGKHYISAGTGAVVTLRGKGSDLSNLEITEAILLDRDAHKIPVQIVPEMKKSEEDLSVGKPAVPQEFSLSQNYPNPFNPETKISYALPTDCHVRLAIYNILGKRVLVLADQHQTAGYKTVYWDGTDDKGNAVASGIYFYKIQAKDFVQSKKMLLMK